MCGIIGLVTDQAGVSEAAVNIGLEALRHRGPDARGVRTLNGSGASCVLGSARLRIIDLSPLADQPMPNEDRTIWVAYNGEIYNFRELRADLEKAGHQIRSRTDTDVLVHLYEQTDGDPERMLARLRGMFAFAVFDAKRGRLLLARDRMGIKPMYWAESGGGVAFASEVKALARAGFASGEPDLGAVASYLSWGVVPGPSTILAGVHELPPGSFLEWHRGAVRTQRWWSPEVKPDGLLAQDAVRLVRGALSDSISRHMIADRPLGAFLSGGIDSGAVVTLAAQAGAVRALTVTFPEAKDEGNAASELAMQVGAKYDRVPVTGAEVAAAMPEILAAMDQPTLDGVNTWIVCRATKQAGLVVALSGLGGDELFGGYPSSRLVPSLAWITRLLAPIPVELKARAARLADNRRPGSRLARILASTGGYPGAYQAMRGMLPETNTSPNEMAQQLKIALGKSAHSQDRVMLLEMAHYLPNQLLRDTDQMSMSHSLEIRVPLLDDALVAVALALPAAVRTQPDKGLLAKAANIEKPNVKQPFALPFGLWMKGPLRETVREGLLSSALPFDELVPVDFRQRLWDAFEADRTHWSRPWAVAVLRLWPEANAFSWR